MQWFSCKMFCNDKFRRETTVMSVESRWNFESMFPSFSAVFLFKFLRMDKIHILLNKTLHRALTHWGFTVSIEWHCPESTAFLRLLSSTRVRNAPRAYFLRGRPSERLSGRLFCRKMVIKLKKYFIFTLARQQAL